MAEIRIGTSGWMYKHWREVFYPKGVPQRVWLEYFAREFNTVELNVTYYRLPNPSTFDGWRERAPEGFLYAVKMSRIITHLKRLGNVEEEVDLFLSFARKLGNHLGPILIQTPPRWHRDIPRLRSFLKLLPNDLRYAFEFRDLSWFHQEVYEQLSEYAMTLVYVTSPDYPMVSACAPFCYVRMHGDETSAKYSPVTLSRWAQHVLTWASEGRDVYIYFNNDIHGYAIEDARALRALVGV